MCFRQPGSIVFRFSFCVRHRVQRVLELKMAGLCLEVALHMQALLGCPQSHICSSCQAPPRGRFYVFQKRQGSVFNAYAHTCTFDWRAGRQYSLSELLDAAAFRSSRHLLVRQQDFQVYLLQIPSFLVSSKKLSQLYYPSSWN